MGNNSNGTREEESSKQYRHHFQFQKKKHKPLHLVLGQQQQQHHHHHHKLKPRELDLNDEAVQGFEPSTSVTRSQSQSQSQSHSQRDVMSKSKFTMREREMGGSSSSCKALWPENAIGALLGMFEEFQASCSISVGSTHQMGKTHWGRIAHALNTACNTSYTGVQCKYKWNRLKKSYTKAKQRGDNSRFPFFSHVDRIVRHALSRKRLTSFAPPPPPKKPSGLKSDAPSVMDDEDDDEDEEDTKGEDDELEDEDDVDSTCEGAATNESKPSSDSSPSHSRSEEDFQDDDDEDINENGVDDDEEEEEEENFVGLASSSKGSKLRSGLKPPELQPVSVSLACFGQRMESSITKLASAMENIEKTRAQEIKSLVDAQLQITTLMLRDRTSKNYDGVSVDRGQPIVDIGSLQLNHGRNTVLTPPVNFAMVDNGLYRSGLPTASNFAFLKTLRLRTIIYLCPDPYPEGSLEFLKAEGIRIFQFAVKIFKEPMTNRPEVTVRDALKTIFDVRNHPLLIHSKREEGSTSFMIGCFRKMQNWCLASIFEEYRRFSGPEFDMSDLEFIECYDTFNTSTMHNYSSFSQVR